MRILETTEFFNYYTKEELLVRDELGGTVEESLLFGYGENVSYFEDLEELEKEAEEFFEWLERENYKIKQVFSTINDKLAFVLISK